uniref:Uncharacterized protein n=1 Tax=Panstrongylus lignarius TaxID=156445 RepID=A0A224Y497_9HEMI
MKVLPSTLATSLGSVLASQQFFIFGKGIKTSSQTIWSINILFSFSDPSTMCTSFGSHIVTAHSTKSWIFLGKDLILRLRAFCEKRSQ